MLRQICIRVCVNIRINVASYVIFWRTIPRLNYRSVEAASWLKGMPPLLQVCDSTRRSFDACWPGGGTHEEHNNSPATAPPSHPRRKWNAHPLSPIARPLVKMFLSPLLEIRGGRSHKFSEISPAPSIPFPSCLPSSRCRPLARS